MPRETEMQRCGLAVMRRLRSALAVLRQIVGAPDYQRYLAHHAARHPDRPPLSPREYYADFVRWRFESGAPTRCC